MEMPLRCSPGIDCWIVNYVDMDPTQGVRDYMCRDASYDTHKGTDIAVMDASVMREGVEVYASATGIVRGVRNDMRDIDFNQGGGATSVEGKECGNGVLLDHGNGWTTQYCHMLRGSVIVAKDDKVEVGQTIGLVGLSGLTEFPHIHIQVKHNEQVVDPFAGLGRTKECGIGKAPLWKTSALLSMLYEPTALYNVGFSSTTPNARIAREGLYGGEVLFEKSPVIALWTDMFWVNQGDKLQFIITGPEGQIMLAHTTTLKKKQARRFAYAGINRNEEPWQKGTYTGEIRLIRPGSDEEYSVIKVINVN
ncbi:MAG: M23 family metallopeptidase [Rhodospirillaceae bacterium]|nr:M23 family metallopeptidase [Rhodospirillaceae bacterium]MBL6942483.1 M23 family metallopeptidase [Rhodospirillales bacterium]